MATHLSVRLAWHDRGWDAHICAAPHLNASCVRLPRIREARDDERERQAADTPFARLPGWLPPCARDGGAYAAHGFITTHEDPLEFRALPAVEEEVLPYSCFASPYRWLREEHLQAVCRAAGVAIRSPDQPKGHGWVFEPDRQHMLLRNFWQRLEAGKSLIFYYCNQGNPVDEDAARILVGVGRIAEIGPQLYYGTKPGFPDHYPVWSRRVTQDYPQQGVRIPYQEYLRAGHAVEGIACPVPASALQPFTFVGEHVSDDIAVAILERIIQSIERVRVDGVVAGDWDGRLGWLNDVLAEVWSGRGAFPGLGSVLQALGFEQGTVYHREVLVPLAQAGKNPWEHVLALLAGGAREEDERFARGVARARERWRVLPPARRDLLADLARYELTETQVVRISDPDRRAEGGLARGGIALSEGDLLANPYLITEYDCGTQTSERVALETIDHGMRPEGDALLFPRAEQVARDDRRRVRGVAREVLEEAAADGDTVLPFGDMLDRVRAHFPARRACQPDRDVVMTEAAFYRDVLWLTFDQDPPLAALKTLRALETHSAEALRRRAAKVNADPERAIAWRLVLEGLFGVPATDRARAALNEKVAALETLFSQRLSILRGGAGTGKTAVLRAFLAEVERAEGKQPVLLLAPTGKARVRLATQTQRDAMTIHQFLLRRGWLTPETFTLRETSEREAFMASMVIIDECSMIPTDVFGTLLRALDLNAVRRLILVGDPNQLPPIGPGRPFIDIISWLAQEHPECIATLQICMRVDEAAGRPEEESVGLRLAEGYRADARAPGDDEILAEIARGQVRGDLDVVFWRDHDDLQAQLQARMATHLNLAPGDYEGFNRALGIPERQWERAEDWQILTPVRTQHFGADELNRLIQQTYRRGLIASALNPRNGSPRPFGDQGIVWLDKVTQRMNQRRSAWPRQGGGLGYVANGEIGIVCQTIKGGNRSSDALDVAFSTQPGVTYRYWPGEINDELELAYALTVHKAQGSDFDTVFFVIPQAAATLSRELIYTALTRFRRRLVLLIERDMAPLLRLRSPAYSDTQRRNSFMFSLALRPDGLTAPYRGALIHRTVKGVAVRSKSEVVVADILSSLGMSYEYEKPLHAKTDPRDFRLPDFTVRYDGDVYYWEHLGMLTLPNYREKWERKRAWYEAQGYSKCLITSSDGLDGGIDAAEIERIARARIMGEDV